MPEPHDGLIAIQMILPRCDLCVDVRFSLGSLPPQSINECEFFLGSRLLG
jgi:hypothetical protein